MIIDSTSTLHQVQKVLARHIVSSSNVNWPTCGGPGPGTGWVQPLGLHPLHSPAGSDSQKSGTGPERSAQENEIPHRTHLGGGGEGIIFRIKYNYISISSKENPHLYFHGVRDKLAVMEAESLLG